MLRVHFSADIQLDCFVAYAANVSYQDLSSASTQTGELILSQQSRGFFSAIYSLYINMF